MTKKSWRGLKLKEEEITKLRSTKDSEIASHRLAKEKEIETLRSTKDEEIAKLKSAKDTLFEEFQTQFKKWDMGTTKQEELKGERDKLSFGELQNAVAEVENKLKNMRGLLSSKERELAGTVKTLDHLWMKLHQSGFNKAASRDVPMFDSVQSKYLRKAVAEKIMANKLCTNIFQQYYLPESPAAREAMDNVLERLYTDNPRGEVIFRRRLLSAYKAEDEEYRVANIMESTQAEVVGFPDPLIFGLDARESFRSELGKLLQEAVKLWRPVQRSAVKGVVENDPEPDWTGYKEYD
ncbi:MAG: hypothetical protein M1839_005661 [Geoglossum umbratile]|nr:MAG: hypothetical protein M1839_005661 [Geoglossum umbratile]